MIGLNALFWMFVLLFAVIGSLRGWAKEILVSFAAILSLFLISVLESFVPFIRDTLAANPDTPIFWMRTLIMGALVFFGYQTPNIPKISGTNKFARDKLQDVLLGFFLGAINAFFIWGSVWYYLHDVGYPFEVINPPIEGSSVYQATLELLPYLPPAWIGPPIIYFAIGIAFAFVLVVFL
ncbi:MAG: hypothetical protein JEZ06_07260 [Anaerolineaceae bacterium]|nr:hypothetical protein [Anaerolineaceae bacterium]